MVKLLSICLLLFPLTSIAKTDCNLHTIYCRIVKLKPNVDKAFAMKLSNSIYIYSKEYNTDPMVSVAIARQESTFTNVKRMGSVLSKGKIVRGVTDIGVFQMHIETIDYVNKKLLWNIDIDRFKTDIDYQTKWHAKLLKRKIKVCENNRAKLRVKVGEEWSCYHSYTPRKREVYKNDVGRYLPENKVNIALFD